MSDGRMYTEEELERKVASQVAQHQIVSLQTSVAHIQNTTAEQYNKIDAQMGRIYERLEVNLTSVTQRITDCRDEFRDEIERDFVTKPQFIKEMNTVEGKIGDLAGKVDRQWVKITTSVTASIAVLGVAAKIVGLL